MMPLVHIRKDLYIAIKSNYFIIFIIFWIFASFLIAEFLTLDYASHASDIYASQRELHEFQVMDSIQYWKNLSDLGGAFTLIVSSLFVANEEENGMARYVSIYGVKPYTLFLSKIISLSLIILFLCLFSYVIYILIFWANTQILLFPLENFQSSILLFVVLVALSCVGGFIGVLSGKRNLSVAISIFYIIISMYISSIGLHLSEDYLSQNYPAHELAHLSNIPLVYKFLIIITPTALMEGLFSIFHLKLDPNEFSLSYISIFGLCLDIIILGLYIFIFNVFTFIILYKKYKVRGDKNYEK